MGCYWSLCFGHLEIAGGNQNYYPEILDLLLKEDFRPATLGCLLGADELLSRLARLGYSESSCKSYFAKYRNDLEAYKDAILFLNDDFTYSYPWDTLSPFIEKTDLNDARRIWDNLFRQIPLSADDRYLHSLVTNCFDAEYIEPYFDQKVNYFILSSLFPNEAVSLEVGEVIEGGYWPRSDFERNRFDEELLINGDEEAYIRYSVIELEENEVNEFKEVTPESVCNSIRKHLSRAAIAFLNNQGGSIYFGVADSGEVRGFETDRTTRDRIANLVVKIMDNVAPPVSSDSYKIKFIPLIENGQVCRDIVCLCITFGLERNQRRYRSLRGHSWFRQYAASPKLDR
jgi:hypothetical protein